LQSCSDPSGCSGAGAIDRIARAAPHARCIPCFHHRRCSGRQRFSSGRHRRSPASIFPAPPAWTGRERQPSAPGRLRSGRPSSRPDSRNRISCRKRFLPDDVICVDRIAWADKKKRTDRQVRYVGNNHLFWRGERHACTGTSVVFNPLFPFNQALPMTSPNTAISMPKLCAASFHFNSSGVLKRMSKLPGTVSQLLSTSSLSSCPGPQPA